MFQPVPRHTIIVLADRVLHLVHGFSGARLQGQAMIPAASASALLEEALPKLGYSGRATLVLGNPWARVDLIRLLANPGGSALDEDMIAQAHARNLPTSAMNGPTAWQPRSFRLKNHLLVAAVPDNTIETVNQVCAARRLVANSIQPLWTWLTLNRSPGFHADRAWSVLAEPGFATIAHQTNGEHDYMRTLRTDEQGPAINDLLARQAAATGFAMEPAETISFAAPPPELSAPWQGSPSGHQLFA